MDAGSCFALRGRIVGSCAEGRRSIVAAAAGSRRISSGRGTRRNLSSAVLPAVTAWPSFWASCSAFFDQALEGLAEAGYRACEIGAAAGLRYVWHHRVLRTFALVLGVIAWVRAANHEWRDVEHGSHDDRPAH